jgi:DNA polymerase-3 subunit chi
MTQVDFYILKDSHPEARPLFTCRLTEKAFMQGHQVYINTESSQQLKQLDDMLWTFRDGSFLPHEQYAAGISARTPILIGHAVEPDGPSDVLVNLSTELLPCFSRFSRVAELVGSDPEQLAAARERYRYYKDRGYTLHTHNP